MPDREAFHNWLVSQGFRRFTTPTGAYPSAHVQTLWECWCAAHAIGLMANKPSQ